MGIQEPDGLFFTDVFLSVLRKNISFFFSSVLKTSSSSTGCFAIKVFSSILLSNKLLLSFFSFIGTLACSSCLQGHSGLHAPLESIRFTSQESVDPCYIIQTEVLAPGLEFMVTLSTSPLK